MTTQPGDRLNPRRPVPETRTTVGGERQLQGCQAELVHGLHRLRLEVERFLDCEACPPNHAVMGLRRVAFLVAELHDVPVEAVDV